MLQTVTGTESMVAARKTLPPKESATEVVFNIIREELSGNGGEIGAALEVALDHVKAKKLAKDIFEEHGMDVLRNLWNSLAGIGEQEYPEPPIQTKGVRPQVKRYTPGSVFDKWVPIGQSGKSRLLGEIVEKDADVILEGYRAHIEGSKSNMGKWKQIKNRLAKNPGKHVKDVFTEEEIHKLELPGRQLK